MEILKPGSLVFFFIFLIVSICAAQAPIGYCGKSDNDIVIQLKMEGYKLLRFASPAMAVKQLPSGSALLILADGYPYTETSVDSSALNLSLQKNLKLYIEFSAGLPGINRTDTVHKTILERVIVNAPLKGTNLQFMQLLSCNDCHFYPYKSEKPLLLIGKVMGFNKAELGISDVETFPLLFEKNNLLIATTKLSNFCTGRYEPNDSWKSVWEFIIGWLTNNKTIHFKSWLSDVNPTYPLLTTLPAQARRTAVARGVEWFFNGRFFIDSSWKDQWLHYQGDGSSPLGPPVRSDLKTGDGSLGILEGHASRIYYDGTEQYRYWLRADVQGEVSFAMASAGHLFNNADYFRTSEKLGNFIFHHSNLRSDARANKDSAVFGLIGWSVTHPYVFYDDDNARCMLGLIGASAYLKTGIWDSEIVENILANLRTSSKQGFQGDRLEEEDIEQNGLSYYQNRDLINPAPHFESWMWACYLWLYNKTGYKPLLEKAKTAIRLTMEAYPDHWKWTNGIQQERARMILPLAWLVQIENTKEHRDWLDQVVSKLLENQEHCGAIREELGNGPGAFGTANKSNKDYGLSEASLIYQNGDPVSDMLYTCNFAFFALNEAAHATGNEKYKDAVRKLSDFLIRIQVRSAKHTDIDGAWFRAFDFKRWDYWASNADVGWGAWSTLTGWIQSWILATQVLVEENNSYWNLTGGSSIQNVMPESVKLFFPDK